MTLGEVWPKIEAWVQGHTTVVIVILCGCLAFNMLVTLSALLKAGRAKRETDRYRTREDAVRDAVNNLITRASKLEVTVRRIDVPPPRTSPIEAILATPAAVPARTLKRRSSKKKPPTGEGIAPANGFELLFEEDEGSDPQR